jgi:hypothetical protein
MTREEMQREHEIELTTAVDFLAGKGPESDWALVRALIHKAVHFTADKKVGEFCALASLLAEMTVHAHEIMHGKGGGPMH